MPELPPILRVLRERLHYCEYFFSREDAERREGYLKTTPGRKGLKLILRETLKSRVWD